MKGKILYVEDDDTLSMITQENLELNGYQVWLAKDGKTASQLLFSHPYDIYILDVMLPGMDGYSLAEMIRKRDIQTPILFLSAKSLKEDRIQGLKTGADDYITKPFSMEELLLKIKIFLKRSQVNDNTHPTKLGIGSYDFDYQNLSLGNQGKEIIVTQREADLILYFAQRKNQVIKRSEILEKIWGEDDYFMGRSLDVFISRLRKYFKEDTRIKLENIHGVGFKLKCPE